MILSAAARRGRSLVVLALTLTVAGLTYAPPAEAKTPALSLEAQRTSVTLYRAPDDEGGGVYGDLQVYAVAGKKRFEVRAKRSSYKNPIVAKLVRKGKDKKLPTPPAFTGLPDFFTTTFRNAAGKVVSRSTSSFCPNVYEPVRRRASAPSTSPYPLGCDANPYSLGAVWGIQAGWAVPMSGFGYAEGVPQDLPLGAYTATVQIAPAYRKALGLSASRAAVAIKVTVKAQPPSPPCDDPDPDVCRSSRRALAQQRVSAALQPTRLTGKSIKPSGPLPDLRSLPAWGIGVAGGRNLTFSATVWNAGPGRLLVDGFRAKGRTDLMAAYQYFFTKSGKQKGYARVGGMEWDDRDGHTHWHFKDFAAYRLLDSKKKLVVRSGKEAFCLANTDAVNYLVKGANWKPGNTDLQTSCGGPDSLGVREVLDTGSGDTYTQDLPGQSFDLNGLRNGTYYIEIRANPQKVLYEKKTSNNSSYRKVVIGGSAGARTVSVARVGVIDEPTDGGDSERNGRQVDHP